MKKLILTAVAVMAATNMWAQGLVTFVNRDTGNGIDAPILASDNITKLSGAAYLADLFYGPVGAPADSLTSLGLAVPFRTGAAAGYITSSGPAIPGFAGGSQVQLQMRAWRASDGATWAAAVANNGEASPIDGRNPSIVITLTSAPNTGAPMTGLVGHSLVIVPEPATILLGLAGIGGLFFLRRKLA